MPMDRQSWMSLVPGSKLQVSFYECKSLHMDKRLPTAPFWSLSLYIIHLSSLSSQGKVEIDNALASETGSVSGLDYTSSQHALYLAF